MCRPGRPPWVRHRRPPGRPIKRISRAALLGLLAFDLAACGTEPKAASQTAEAPGSTAPMSFDAFMLKQAHAELTTTRQGLAVNRVSWGDDLWSGSQKLNLRYCVSGGFGANKARVVSAMASAAAAWEQYAVVDFIHDASQDASCTNANPNVTFDVNLVNVGGQYLARAFFPSSPRSSRNVYIDVTAFSSSWAVRRHQLRPLLPVHQRPGRGHVPLWQPGTERPRLPRRLRHPPIRIRPGRRAAPLLVRWPLPADPPD